jgi:hypothetical protein
MVTVPAPAMQWLNVVVSRKIPEKSSSYSTCGSICALG